MRNQKIFEICKICQEKLPLKNFPYLKRLKRLGLCFDCLLHPFNGDKYVHLRELISKQLHPSKKRIVGRVRVGFNQQPLKPFDPSKYKKGRKNKFSAYTSGKGRIDVKLIRPPRSKIRFNKKGPITSNSDLWARQFPIQCRDDYHSYLQSELWKLRARDIRKRSNYTCQKCGFKPGKRNRNLLHVHHKTYKRIGQERISDLQCLCHICHNNYHK